MEARKLLDALIIAERLKDTTRHCYTSKGRHESVAEHSWMMTLMAFFMRDEFPDVDMDKVIRMCIIHDLGEAFTGDIPTFEKTEANEQTEEELTTIVDLGGSVVDITVEHDIYGKMTAPLNIKNRRDVQLFIKQMNTGRFRKNSYSMLH